MSTKFRTLKAMVFLVLMYGCESWTIKRLRAEELMFLNCGIGEDSWESPGLQRDQTSQSERKSTLNIHRKDWLMLKLSSYLTHLMRRANSLEKTPNAGRDRRQEEKGMTEDEMVAWHHWLNGHEFEQALRDSQGQGSLTCCSPRGCQELDTTKWLKNNTTIDTMYKIDSVCVQSLSHIRLLWPQGL